jgi:hypothetical protein
MLSTSDHNPFILTICSLQQADEIEHALYAVNIIGNCTRTAWKTSEWPAGASKETVQTEMLIERSNTIPNPSIKLFDVPNT